MSFLEWKPEYAVGVEAVDREHQLLIELINQAHQEMNPGGSRERLQEFVGEIYARISAHFALEEQIMREAGYDQLLDHKENHELLLDEIADIIDEVSGDSAKVSERLAERLNDWFSIHFKTHDARLHNRLG